jgi:hypothetical protein
VDTPPIITTTSSLKVGRRVPSQVINRREEMTIKILRKKNYKGKVDE